MIRAFRAACSAIIRFTLACVVLTIAILPRRKSKIEFVIESMGYTSSASCMETASLPLSLFFIDIAATVPLNRLLPDKR